MAPNVKHNYNFNMDIKTQIKILLTLKHVSVEQLANAMTEQMNKPYTAAKIYGKLNRDSITFTECQNIAKILGYEIIFKKIK